MSNSVRSTVHTASAVSILLYRILNSRCVSRFARNWSNGCQVWIVEFDGIIEDTCTLRDRYCPEAKVSVLSNSTQLGRADVVRALKRCDNRILKLDSAIDNTMRLIDRPVNHDLTVEQIVRHLELFDGDFTLQTCFLRGDVPGGYVDNTTPTELDAWYKIVRKLNPKQIMIYVIDRATPVKTLEKISREQMESIAAPIQADGFEVIISA